MNKGSITLADRYMHPLFFKEQEVELPRNGEEHALYSPLFQPDLQATYHGYNPPWESFENWLEILLNEWNLLKEELQPLFEVRSKEAEPLMVKGLSLFYMMIYWSNGRAVDLNNWETSIKELQVSFVNPVERLSFIINRPSMYFSYRQLDEIFTELHKAIAKNQMIKNRKRT
ncbi:YpoC family protein [Jeotgalibacillus marinus]|uniref:YpoC family protein n=1 Tax=Jeotgalibacillus marinus TaxID=86667 RepID=A0ABV3PYL9_9BACL